MLAILVRACNGLIELGQHGVEFCADAVDLLHADHVGIGFSVIVCDQGKTVSQTFIKQNIRGDNADICACGAGL